jgi:urease alpha subunit
MSHLIGSVAVGQMADLAFWDFDSFGARPNMIVKGGVIAWAQVSPFHPSFPYRHLVHTDIRWEMQMVPSLRSNQSSVVQCGDITPQLLLSTQ